MVRWKDLPKGLKVAGGTGDPPKARIKRPRQMNKTEAAYAQLLDLRQRAGQIEWWAYEPIKLRLAVTTFYTPDFMVQQTDNQLLLVEVKGFWRDDARVKIKVAAELFPMFKFIAVRRFGESWETEEL